jgi:WD40 repeat protein
MWDVTARPQCWVSRARPISINRVVWSSDGTRLVSGSEDGSLYVWDVSDGTLLQTLQGHHGMVASVTGVPMASGSPVEAGAEEVGRCCRGMQTVDSSCTLLPTLPVVYLLWSGASVESCWSCKQRRDTALVGCTKWGVCEDARNASGAVQALRISPHGRKLAICGEDGLTW